MDSWHARNPDPDVLIRDDCAVLKSMVTPGMIHGVQGLWLQFLRFRIHDFAILKALVCRAGG